MNNTFVIAWRSATSERSGRGKKLMTLEEAEALADELNREYPAFIHEPVDTEAPVAEAQAA
jgi:hypothetical protein